MENLINQAWEHRHNRENINKDMENAVFDILRELNLGKLRVAQKVNGVWQTNEWVKKAILISFILYENKIKKFNDNKAYDKIPLKFANWQEDDFKKANFRVLPGAIVRYTAYIERSAIIMPSFINMGASIGEGTLIDTWSTVGTCAQIGKNCHISGGVGIGGVLEPLQANPVIIENNVFIGARSEVAEGVIIGEGAVLSMGVYLGASTRIYNRETDEIIYGKVPPLSVVIPGVLPSSDGKTLTYAAIIVKTVDEQTRSKTSINDILRR